jgi:hypothetical protein
VIIINNIKTLHCLWRDELVTLDLNKNDFDWGRLTGQILCHPGQGIHTGPNVIKYFTNFRKEAGVFLLGKAFQNSVMFVGKARSLP